MGQNRGAQCLKTISIPYKFLGFERFSTENFERKKKTLFKNRSEFCQTIIGAIMRVPVWHLPT